MLDQTMIRNLLPHRHPMVLLDRVDHLETGVLLVASKAITATEPCYRELAAAAPPWAYAYPVSLLIESFGQAAAVLWLHSVSAGARSKAAPGRSDRLLMFGALRDCRFEGEAFPGDVVRHEVRLDHRSEATGLASGASWVGKRRIAVMGSFLAMTRPRDAILGPSALDTTVLDSSRRTNGSGA